MSFFAELKRRKVVRVGIAYVVIAWVVAQVAGFAVEVFGAPGWVMKIVVVFLALGLPFALFFAWAFELTPEGLKREKDVDRSASISTQTGRRLDRVIIGVLVVAVALFALDRFYRQQPEPGAAVADEKRSIAVLPFANMSGSPDQDYFSDGIAEEILNSLVRVEGLSVASRTSSFQFRDQSRGIPAIAEALQVLFVLEGSVRRSGDDVRITAQLIDAEHDRHVWSETYDRSLTEIFTVQSDIANAITKSLEQALGLENLATVPTRNLTANMNAYDLYLKGHGLFAHRTQASDVSEAISLLERAVELDPSFAAAWESLGAAYSVAPSWGIRESGAEVYFERAEAAVDRALQIDPGLAFALAVKGNIVSYKVGHREEVTGLLEASLERDPRNPTTLGWYGNELEMLGYLDQAVAAYQQCLGLDPMYANCLRYLSFALTYRGRAEQATAVANQWLAARVGADPYFGPVEALLFFERGQRAAGLLVLNALPDLLSGAPWADWLRAIDNPDADYSASLALLASWASEAGVDLDEYPELAAVFGSFPATIGPYSEGWYWLPRFRGYRGTTEFKRMIEASGILGYWRAKGFPAQCRPIGVDDFECD